MNEDRQTEQDQQPELMTPGEVAAVFRVDPRTVWAWACADKISCVYTPGGQRRYRRAEIDQLLAGSRIAGM